MPHFPAAAPKATIDSGLPFDLGYSDGNGRGGNATGPNQLYLIGE
jgi:hypothetical protein